jgi:hypothetical protein
MITGIATTEEGRAPEALVKRIAIDLTDYFLVGHRDYDVRLCLLLENPAVGLGQRCLPGIRF